MTKKTKTTIGAMCGSRGTWGEVNPVTKVVENKKGKGSYSRKEKYGKTSFFSK